MQKTLTITGKKFSKEQLSAICIIVDNEANDNPNDKELRKLANKLHHVYTKVFI